MRVCVCVCECVGLCMYVCAYIFTFTCMYMPVSILTCLLVYVYMCVRVCVRLCISISFCQQFLLTSTSLMVSHTSTAEYGCGSGSHPRTSLVRAQTRSRTKQHCLYDVVTKYTCTCIYVYSENKGLRSLSDLLCFSPPSPSGTVEHFNQGKDPLVVSRPGAPVREGDVGSSGVGSNRVC